MEEVADEAAPPPRMADYIPPLLEDSFPERPFPRLAD